MLGRATKSGFNLLLLPSSSSSSLPLPLFPPPNSFPSSSSSHSSPFVVRSCGDEHCKGDTLQGVGGEKGRGEREVVRGENGCAGRSRARDPIPSHLISECERKDACVFILLRIHRSDPICPLTPPFAHQRSSWGGPSSRAGGPSCQTQPASPACLPPEFKKELDGPRRKGAKRERKGGRKRERNEVFDPSSSPLWHEALPEQHRVRVIDQRLWLLVQVPPPGVQPHLKIKYKYK